MRLLGLLLGVLLMLLVACGEETGEQIGDAPNGDAEEGAVEISGALQGDAELEGGCAWLQAADERYEVHWPEGYAVSFDPLQLTGPDGEVVAEEGDEVTVSGRVAEDRASVCMVGTIFEAAAVQGS